VFMAGSAVVKGLGKKIFSIGDDLALRSIRPSPSQQRNFFKRTGVKLKDFVIDKGLFSKGTQQVDVLIDPLQKSFDDVALASGRAVSPEDVSKMFDAKMGEFADIPTKQAQQIAKKLAAEKELFMKKFGVQETIDIGDITKLRRQIDKLVSPGRFTKSPVAAGTERATREIYQDTVRQATGDMTDQAGRNLTQMGQDLKKLYEFKDIALMQEGLGRGTLPFGLIRTIATVTGGTAGFAHEGDIGGAVKGILIANGLTWAANNPKVVSFMSKNLMTIGRGLEGVPDNQKAKIITSAFRRLLSNLMAVNMTQWGQEEVETETTHGLFKKPENESPPPSLFIQ
jgi:hypothetical protein